MASWAHQVFNVVFIALSLAMPLAATGLLVAADGHSRVGARTMPLAVTVGAAACLAFWLLAALLALRPDIVLADGVVPRFRLNPAAVFLGGVLMSTLMITLHPQVRRLVQAAPISWSIGLQTGRVMGGAFFLSAALGETPWTFALIAGTGDVLVGLSAPLVARRATVENRAGRRLALWHTLFGLADFMIAIATASLLRAQLPWPIMLIPTFLVPLAIATHVWTLMALKLRRAP